MNKREDKNTRKRLAKFETILRDEKVSHCYIKKGGFYYRENQCGYTELRSSAGVYNKEEAIVSGRFVGSLNIVPINTEEHNEMINKEIKELEKRLIKVVG